MNLENETNNALKFPKVFKASDNPIGGGVRGVWNNQYLIGIINIISVAAFLINTYSIMLFLLSLSINSEWNHYNQTPPPQMLQISLFYYKNLPTFTDEYKKKFFEFLKIKII